MEPHRPIASTLHRKPLGDCTNTISSVKFANPSLTSSLKRLVDQTSLKEKHYDDEDDVTASKSLSTTLRPVTRRVSADLCFPAITPSRKRKDVDKSESGYTRVSTDLCFPGQNSRYGAGVGGGDKEVAEPYSVYTVRRKAASGIKRSKDAVASLRLDLIPSPVKKRRQANENTAKPSKVAPIKRQRKSKHDEDNSANGVSQDYIEKQRAYFAEVDAFELAEEEVSESDLD